MHLVHFLGSSFSSFIVIHLIYPLLVFIIKFFRYHQPHNIPLMISPTPHDLGNHSTTVQEIQCNPYLSIGANGFDSRLYSNKKKIYIYIYIYICTNWTTRTIVQGPTNKNRKYKDLIIMWRIFPSCSLAGEPSPVSRVCTTPGNHSRRSSSTTVAVKQKQGCVSSEARRRSKKISAGWVGSLCGYLKEVRNFLRENLRSGPRWTLSDIPD